MPDRIVIDLRTHVAGREGPVAERLAVEQLAPNRFRLLQSPGIVEGLAANDEFELAPLDPLGYRVLRRGGNLSVWFFFEMSDQVKSPEANRIRKAVEALGGYLDGGGHYLLVFTIPAAAGFPAIEHVFAKAQERNPGSTWMFGNVYDPKDGQTPLNWW